MVDDDGVPIDAVLTWVDGADPHHKAKLAAYRGETVLPESVAGETRFKETGEFAYCIASLLRFMPWLRRIWIVTDAQIPPFMGLLQQSSWSDKVSLVDHREIFSGYERYLPTFNSITLNALLWRIPGLAERFIYLNDDFLLLRPVAPEAFFRGDKLVLVGRWDPQRVLFDHVRRMGALWWARMRGRTPGCSVGNHHTQALSAYLAGYWWRYFRAPHVPHPMLRSLLADYAAEYPALFEANLRHRFRSDAQFLGDALVSHLALLEQRAVVDNHLRGMRLKYLDYQRPRLERLLAQADHDLAVVFFCMQDLESVPEERRRIVFDWLNRRVGRPECVLSGSVPDES